MPPTIFQLLEALPAHFAPSAAAAEQAYDAARELVILAQNHGSAGLSGEQSHLER